uniref:TrmE-type G domain-containing protein n=1 Tax=Amphimedon queenslandica TaxID=400682 RepID=A0A1X7V7Q2_AMPQE
MATRGLVRLFTRTLFDMSSSSGDTVFALSSGQGKCGVAVIRVSGPRASDVILNLGQFKSLPKPRAATLRRLRDPLSGDIIDHGLSIWFPGPNSFTGEDCVEFHVHGGKAVISSVLNSLSSLPGLKHAEPGDFTKRALLNGKLDLTEVEGLSDLIHAETEAQRKQALRQMKGDLSKLYNGWSESLLKSLANVEAIIDFGEDENIEEGLLEQVCRQIEELSKEIQSHLQDGRRGERLRSGIQVTIIGAPNAGKSSLLNILCQRPAAIVSPYAGTTRDVIESSLDISGYPVVISDTAGLRQVSDPVEKEGIKRAVERVESADLNILIVDSSLCKDNLSTLQCPEPEVLKKLCSMNPSVSEERVLERLNHNNTLIVMNKTDLLPSSHTIAPDNSNLICWVSCTTRKGIENFLDVLKNRLQMLGGDPLADSPHLTQQRHRHHLQDCSCSIQRFLDCVKKGESDIVVAAEELRSALKEIGRITGKTDVEEILDVIFKDFCIGK